MLTISGGQSDDAGSPVLRLARGAIQSVDNTFVIDGQLKITVEGAKPTITSDGGTQELRVAIPKQAKSEIKVQLRW